MGIEVERCEGKVLVDVESTSPCCLTLEASEAIDLAQQLIAVAVTVEPPAGAAAVPLHPFDRNQRRGDPFRQ